MPEDPLQRGAAVAAAADAFFGKSANETPFRKRNDAFPLEPEILPLSPAFPLLQSNDKESIPQAQPDVQALRLTFSDDPPSLRGSSSYYESVVRLSLNSIGSQEAAESEEGTDNGKIVSRDALK